MDDHADDFHFTGMGDSPPPPWMSSRSRRSTQEHDATLTQIAIACLAASGDPKLVARAARIAGCRKQWFVIANWRHPRRSVAYRRRCWDSLCSDCYRATKIESLMLRELVVRERLKAGELAYLVTLTQWRNASEGILESRERMRRAYTELQDQPGFRTHVTGWMSRREDPWAPGAGYHSHIHAVLTAPTSPEAWLARWWPRVTGDPEAGFHVDAVPASDIRHVIAYLAKPREIQGPEVVDIALHLKGAQDVSFGGAFWRRPAESPRDPSPGEAPTDACELPAGHISLGALQRFARKGDGGAAAVLAAVHAKVYGARPRGGRRG